MQLGDETTLYILAATFSLVVVTVLAVQAYRHPPLKARLLCAQDRLIVSAHAMPTLLFLVLVARAVFGPLSLIHLAATLLATGNMTYRLLRVLLRLI